MVRRDKILTGITSCESEYARLLLLTTYYIVLGRVSDLEILPSPLHSELPYYLKMFLGQPYWVTSNAT